MSLVVYTKTQLIQRIRKHVSNGYSNDDFSCSDKEILLYIDQAAAFNLVGQVWGQAKVEGNIAIPEAYLTTYLLPAAQQDSNTNNWYSTLPQTPISLPLGYSISDAYFASVAFGKSQPIFLIKAKRKTYRDFMPKPTGVLGWVENTRFWLEASDGSPLSGINVYVQMAKTRTDDINEVLNFPDDAIEGIFNNVVAKLDQRYGQPKDIIKDDIGATVTTGK